MRFSIEKMEKKSYRIFFPQFSREAAEIKTADKMLRTCSKHLKNLIIDELPGNCPRTENL
jgi:hypothetical protein